MRLGRCSWRCWRSLENLEQVRPEAVVRRGRLCLHPVDGRDCRQRVQAGYGHVRRAEGQDCGSVIRRQDHAQALKTRFDSRRPPNKPMNPTNAFGARSLSAPLFCLSIANRRSHRKPTCNLCRWGPQPSFLRTPSYNLVFRFFPLNKTFQTKIHE